MPLTVNMLHQLGRGVVWTYATMAVSGVLQLAVVALTARLLPPEAFGLVAMANVVLRFSSYFANMGVGRALIQRQHIDEDDVRAAFTSSVAMGLATTATVITLAPFAAAYYQDRDVTAVMQWLALTFVFTGLGATSRALLQRRLQFRASGVAEVASYAIGYAVPTLVLAASGFGVWSLVAGAIGQAAVAAAISMWLASHSWKPMLRWAPHARLLRFGATVSGISVLEFLGSTLDTLVIGRFGTAAQVGLYNRAFMLAHLPTYQVQLGIARVLFPVLTAGRSNATEFSTTIVVASHAAARLVLPLGIGMGLAAPELVDVLLGKQWAAAAPLLGVLGPALALNLLWAIPAQVLEALGRLRWKAVVHGSYVVLLGVALTVSAATSVDLGSVALVLALAMACRTIALFAVVHFLGVVRPGYTLTMVRTTVVTAALAVGAFTVSLGLTRWCGAPSAVTLMVAISVGCLILVVVFWQEVVRWTSGFRGTRGGAG